MVADIPKVFAFSKELLKEIDDDPAKPKPEQQEDKFERVAKGMRSATNKLDGKDAGIIVKINSLTDDKIVRALYRASQAGVKVDLIVRGICVLRPGIAGLSDNIRVVSIVGRFLEHSRIFYFANDGNAEIYIGSADWMHRNLDRRVEAVVPIKDEAHKIYLKEEILAAYLQDNVNASVLQPDGTYEKISIGEGEIEFDSQTYFVGQEI